MPPNPADDRRLTAIEENLLFVERRLDDLHQVALDLGARLDASERRIGGLERALREAADAEDDDSEDDDPLPPSES